MGWGSTPSGTLRFKKIDGSFWNGETFRFADYNNYGANRRLVIEKNIEDGEGYTVTMFNLDGMHPLWQNNIQMSPKRMRITNVSDNIVQLRGYGYDSMGASFADYGVVLLIENEEIIRVQLNMYDRNISIVYLK